MNRIPAILSVALAVTVARPASADDAQCAALLEEGGTLQKDGELIAASGKLRACAENVNCQSFIRDECKKILNDAMTAIPHAKIIVVGPDGKQTLAFSLTIDGAPYEGRRDKPIEVDPGERSFVVTIEGETRQATVPFLEGEEKPVELSFAPEVEAPPPSPEPDAAAPPARALPPADDGLSGIQTAGIAIGAVGLVGVVVGAALGGVAVSKNGEADDLCANRPTCPGISDADRQQAVSLVDEANGLATGGWVAIGIGGAAAITGLILALTGGDEPEEDTGTGWTIRPTFTGTQITF